MRVTAFADWRFISHPHPTGVGKHLSHVLTGLAQIPGLLLTRLAAADQLSTPPSFPSLTTHALPFGWHLSQAAWAVSGLPFADAWADHPDWVYCPKNDFVPLRRARVAFTVHGAPELDPGLPQPRGSRAVFERLRSRAIYHRALSRADRILTVSGFLKDWVVRHFKTSPDKIQVVGNGVEPDYFAAAQLPRQTQTSNPVILAIGGLNYLDGGDRLLAFARVLQRELPDFRLQLAGRNHDPALAAGAAALKNLTLLGYQPANQLARRLRNAFAFLYPTRYETFGIAGAEALAAGTPVIASLATAVPETLGAAALYARDPDDPGELVDLVRELARRPALRDSLVDAGRTRAGQFTWAGVTSRVLRALSQ